MQIDSEIQPQDLSLEDYQVLSEKIICKDILTASKQKIKAKVSG